jgi:Domain of unknown function (DUF932)
VSLVLHTGAQLVSYDDLRSVQTPSGTDTHVPVAHHEIVELVRYTLGFFGHEIVEEAHGITEGGSRYFGLMSLRSPYTDYTDTLGLRNSHDKSFPIGLAFGSRVLVCDNLSFIGENVIRRRHTVKARRELLGLLSEIIGPLREQRLLQSDTFLRYKAKQLTDEQADHAILDMYRKDIVGITRVADVLQQWENPTHDWGDRTCWRLFNAATFALTGKVAERPDLTRQLHQVIDGVCGVVH